MTFPHPRKLGSFNNRRRIVVLSLRHSGVSVGMGGMTSVSMLIPCAGHPQGESARLFASVSYDGTSKRHTDDNLRCLGLWMSHTVPPALLVQRKAPAIKRATKNRMLRCERGLVGTI